MSEDGEPNEVWVLRLRLVELDAAVLLTTQPRAIMTAMRGTIVPHPNGADVRLGSIDTQFVWHVRVQDQLLRIHGHLSDVDGYGWHRESFVTLPCNAAVSVARAEFTTPAGRSGPSSGK